MAQPTMADAYKGLSTCRQIRAARALLGWTQRDLGTALGVNERQVRFWERRIPANRSQLRKIVEAFAVAGVEFIGPQPSVSAGWVTRNLRIVQK